MSKRCKVRSKRNFAFGLIAIVFIITLQVNAKNKGNTLHVLSYSAFVDSPPPIKRPKLTDSISKRNSSVTDTITVNDSTRKDSVVKVADTLNVKLSKDSLDAPVTYSAEDSGVLIIPTKEFVLYGKADTKYTDDDTTASTINLNQEKQLLTAFGATDTTGNPLNKPKLVQGDMTSVSDTIWYNTRSQKGLTKGTNLQQGEMYVYAQTVKKINANTIFAWRGRFTTCNLDTPH